MKPNAPAFPSDTIEYDVSPSGLSVNGKKQFSAGGLTTRDYIAIEMAKGILSNNDFLIGTYAAAKANGRTNTDVVSICAYEFADALIAESNKK